MARVYATSNTHLYPGARLAARTGGVLRRGAQVLIEFSDLGQTSARVVDNDAGRLTLSVASHRTRRGTTVAARIWLIVRADVEGRADERIVYRVIRRLAATH